MDAPLSANLLTCRFILVNCSTGPSALTWVDTDCAGRDAARQRGRLCPVSLVSAVSPGSLLNERSLRDSTDTLAYLLSTGLVLPSSIRCRGPGIIAEDAERLTSAVATACWLTPIRASLIFLLEEFHV